MPRPILIKLGGSLIQQESGEVLRQLGNIISRYGQRHPVLIVPGGGPFADLVREYGKQLDLSEETCHFMALGAMDQYAFILQERIPGSKVTVLPAARYSRPAVRGISAGSQILICSHCLGQVPASDLARSWNTTSDSIAAYLARRLNCSMLVLVKSKDIEPTLQEPDVDLFFRQLLPLAMPAWFLNGSDPERLRVLLETGQTRGVFLPPGSRWAQARL